MSGEFYLTGFLLPSNTGRSFKVYALTDNGKTVFIGLISQKALRSFLLGEIPQADICQYAESKEQAGIKEPLNFNWRPLTQ